MSAQMEALGKCIGKCTTEAWKLYVLSRDYKLYILSEMRAECSLEELRALCVYTLSS